MSNQYNVFVDKKSLELQNRISKKSRQHNGQKKKKIVRGLIWRNNILAVYNRQGFSNIRIIEYSCCFVFIDIISLLIWNWTNDLTALTHPERESTKTLYIPIRFCLLDIIHTNTFLFTGHYTYQYVFVLKKTNLVIFDSKVNCSFIW